MTRASRFGIGLLVGASLVVSACGGEQGASRGENPTGVVPLVDTQNLKLAMAGDDPPLLLDVRTPGEYAEGHLQDALLMPSYSVEARLGELEPYRDRAIVVYCEVGVRSLRIAKLLLTRGFDDVLHYQGGVRAWKAAGEEVVK